MTFVPTLAAYLIGLPMGVLLTTTKPGGIMAAPTFNAVFGWLVNLFRSIPFMILIFFVLPVTRLIVGTSIGATAPTCPWPSPRRPSWPAWWSRAWKRSTRAWWKPPAAWAPPTGRSSPGCCWWKACPACCGAFPITIITIFGYTAVTGAVGAGGLGNIAFRFGYQRYQTDVMYATVVLVVILVCIIQSVCSFLARKSDKRNR